MPRAPTGDWCAYVRLRDSSALYDRPVKGHRLIRRALRMISSLISLIASVSKRILNDWLIVSAAFVTILLAMVLLASGPIYADSVALSALQRSLTEAPAGEANISVGIRVFPRRAETATRIVESEVREALASVGFDVYTRIEAGAHSLAEDEDVVDLASVQYLEGVESYATLLTGSWPGDAGPPYETAISETLGRTLGVGQGDLVEVTDRRDPDSSAELLVVGLYEVDDPADVYWFGDDLALVGSVNAGGFRTFGPLLVSLHTMRDVFTPARSSIEWRILPNFGDLSVEEVDDLRAGVAALPDALNRALLEALAGDLDGSSEFTVESRLSDLLAGVDRSLGVTRAGVLAVLAQLALLAGYALALTAGLMVSVRRAETGLMRSRGASPIQIVVVALAEGLLLTAPAVLIAPYLASAALGVFNRFGPLASIGLTISPAPTEESFVVAGVAGLLALVGLTWPAFRAAGRSERVAATAPREQSQRPAQRLGVDLALIALAAVAFWQLQVLGPEVGARVRGRFGVDPVLIVAPALGLLAGAVLALRIVPLLARAMETIAASGRRAVSALAAWQVARRPARYARSSLLLIIAVGVGFFAASYSTTWAASQGDQAAHLVGSEFSVDPDTRPDAQLSDLALPTAHEMLDGVTASMPVQRASGSLASGDRPIQFLLIDAAKAGDVVRIRSDLAPGFDDLMTRLVRDRPTMPSVRLPGEPNALALEFETVEIPPEEDLSIHPDTGPSIMVNVILQDGNDQIHRIAVRPLRIDLGRRRMVVDLTESAVDGSPATPAYPLALVSVEFASLVPEANHTLDVVFHGGHVRNGRDWSEIEFSRDWTDWTLSQSAIVGAERRPSIAPGEPSSDGLRVVIETGVAFPPNRSYFSLRPAGSSLPDTYQVLVSASFIDARSFEIGDQTRLTPLRVLDADAVIAGVFESFPTVESPDAPVVIADLPTIQMLSYEPGFGLSRVSQYWIAAGEGTDEITATLEAPPFRSLTVVSARDLTEALVSDPVALGTIGALTIGFVAAALFAIVGFAVSATVSARERLVEFALIRAVGLSNRQLSGWLALEQGVLIGVGLILGTLTGGLLTSAVLPQISLTQGGAAAVPEAQIVYPWETILGFETALVAALVVAVVVMTFSLRRLGLGSLLRLGEDR
jgi:ABC-type antimicrobial peptide transport system permease subunit